MNVFWCLKFGRSDDFTIMSVRAMKTSQIMKEYMVDPEWVEEDWLDEYAEEEYAEEEDWLDEYAEEEYSEEEPLVDEPWAEDLRDEVKACARIPRAKNPKAAVRDYEKVWSEFVNHETEAERIEKAQMEMVQIHITWRIQSRSTAVGVLQTTPGILKRFVVGNFLKLSAGQIAVIVPIVGVDKSTREVRVLYELGKGYEFDDLDADLDLACVGVLDDYVRKNSVLLHELPAVVDIEFLPNLITFIRQKMALKDLLALVAGPITPIKMFLVSCYMGIDDEYTIRKPDLPQCIIPGTDKKLDRPQSEAVSEALVRPFPIIQGPPGTGKTTMIAGFVYFYLALYPNHKLLLCGPSNTSTDHLAYVIDRMLGRRVVRYYSQNVTNVPSNIQHINVATLCAEICPRLGELMERYHLLTDYEREEYKALYEETVSEILDRNSVICCTTNMAGSKMIRGRGFHCVVVDEAPQASDVECLIPFLRSEGKVVLVGDHKQLGPIPKSDYARKMKYTTTPPHLRAQGSKPTKFGSVFHRLVEMMKKKHVLLSIQYRMHPSISEFPSKMFYMKQIIDGVTAEQRRSPIPDFPWPNREHPLAFIDVQGEDELGREDPNCTSFVNVLEAEQIVAVLRKFHQNGIASSQIGVITPYAAQTVCITGMVANSPLQQWSQDLIISSVDGFQGSERDYILFSSVRSNDRGDIGFLDDPCRLNVAITRARLGLIIVGNRSFLARQRTSKLWQKLVEFFKKKKAVMRSIPV